MIRIAQQPESESFRAIKEKGNAWLAKNGIPPDRFCSQEFGNGKEFWNQAWDDFYVAYNGICAYSCLPVGPGGTIDHFQAKSQHPSLAYDWANYRLAASRINSRKRDHQQIFDPFLVPEEAFLLDVLTGEIYPNPEKEPQVQAMAASTIRLLHLDSSSMRYERLKWLNGYDHPDQDQRLPEAWISQNAPFIHAELKRQKLL